MSMRRILVAIAGLTATVALASAAQAALTLNYKFNELSGTSIADTSGNAYTGTVVENTVGASQLNQAGRYAGAKAIHLNGGNAGDTPIAYVNSGQTAGTIGFGSTYTAIGWVKLDNVSGDNMVFGTDASDPRLHDGFRNANPHQGHWGSDTTAGTVNANQWYQVAYRWSPGTNTLFVDGASVGGGAINVFGNPTRPLWIGATGGNGGDFAGYIDEIGVFNTALSDRQVAAAFFAGRDINERYDLDQINSLFNRFAAGSGSTSINGTFWVNDPTVAANAFLSGTNGTSTLLLAAGAGNGGLRGGTGSQLVALGFGSQLPEPGTYAIGSLMLLVGGAYGWKKRRSVKK